MGYYIYGKTETIQKRKISLSTYIQRALIIAIWFASTVNIGIWITGILLGVEYSLALKIALCFDVFVSVATGQKMGLLDEE